MKCKNCGNELTDGSLFCPECGTKVEQSEAPAEVETASEAAPQAEETASEAPKAPKKGKQGLVILGIVIAAVVLLLVVIIVAGSRLFASNHSVDDKALVYIKDDSLYYTSNMDKDKEALKVTDLKMSKDDYYYKSWLNLTESGKYIYFYSSFNADGNGTLCRIRTSKISKNEDKNDAAVEKINSNVSSYSLIDDDTFLYKKGGDKLYYFNGKEDVDIDKNVTSYRYLRDEKAVLYVGGSKSKLCLYYLKKGETEELASNVDSLVNAYNENFIVYRKSVEYTTADGYNATRTDYYYTDLKGQGDKIDSDIYRLVTVDGEQETVYFVKTNQIGGCLYDFVDDIYLGGKEIPEPQKTDFFVACTEYDAMSDYDRDYYSRYPDAKERYFYGWLSTDSSTGMKYTAHYVDGDYVYFYYDEDAEQWYRLNQQAYDEANKEYAAFKNLDNLRQNLKDYSYQVETYDLYKLVKGSDPECLAEGIDANSLDYSADAGLFLYEKTPAVGDVKVGIDKFDNVYAAYDLINKAIHPEYYDDSEDQTNEIEIYYYLAGEKQLDTKEFGEITGLNSLTVSQDCKQVVVGAAGEDANYVLYNISGSELKDGTALDEDAYRGKWVDNTYYFYVLDDPEDEEGDLCKFVKGKTEVVLKRVTVNEITYYGEDDIYAVMDSPEYNNYGRAATLRLYNAKGDDIKVDTDVTAYTYINSKRVVYMQDDDLYIYNGKEKTRRISRSVEEYDCYSQNGITY